MTTDNVIDTTDSSIDKPKRKRYLLEKGWVKTQLIRELAMGEIPQTELAIKYGVGQSAIGMFKIKYRTQIDTVQESLSDEFAGMWIAEKRSRLAELQSAAEALIDSPITPRSAEVIAKLLKDAAEELGDLPNRSQVNVAVANVTYEVVGVDLEDLK